MTHVIILTIAFIFIQGMIFPRWAIIRKCSNWEYSFFKTYGIDPAPKYVPKIKFDTSHFILLVWYLFDRLSIRPTINFSSALFLGRELGPGPRFTNGFASAFQIRWKFRFTLISSLTLIATKFCTCQESCAVVACAKNCRDLVANNGITLHMHLRDIHYQWLESNCCKYDVFGYIEAIICDNAYRGPYGTGVWFSRMHEPSLRRD